MVQYYYPKMTKEREEELIKYMEKIHHLMFQINQKVIQKL